MSRGLKLADIDLAGEAPTAEVDIYNATSGSWTRYPKGLGQARGFLAAASLSSGLVFFAGGQVSGKALLESYLQLPHILCFLFRLPKI